MGGNPTGLWLSELADPYYALKEAGLDVTIASIAGGAIPIDPGSMGENFFGEKAKQFMHDQAAVGALTHSVKVQASMADQFDCVYLAGGHGCCVDFVGEQGKELKALIEAAYAAGKIVAADCHGPMGLLEATIDGAPLVKGLEVTAFTNLEEDQAGATEWVQASARISRRSGTRLTVDLRTGQGQHRLHGGRVREAGSRLQEGRPLDVACMQGGQPHHGAEPAVGGRLCGGGDRGAGVSPTPSTRVANNCSR